jgi:hypothetical protein
MQYCSISQNHTVLQYQSESYSNAVSVRCMQYQSEPWSTAVSVRTMQYCGICVIGFKEEWMMSIHVFKNIDLNKKHLLIRYENANFNCHLHLWCPGIPRLWQLLYYIYTLYYLWIYQKAGDYYLALHIWYCWWHHVWSFHLFHMFHTNHIWQERPMMVFPLWDCRWLAFFLFHSELWEGPHLCAELDG